MIFAGIFGVENKSKIVNEIDTGHCFACRNYGKYIIEKNYTYFHFFFIPLFKWNTKYILKTTCCNKVYLLNALIGEKIEKGENVLIFHSDLELIYDYSFEYCPKCNRKIERDFIYCPYCGEPIK